MTHRTRNVQPAHRPAPESQPPNSGRMTVASLTLIGLLAALVLAVVITRQHPAIWSPRAVTALGAAVDQVSRPRPASGSVAMATERTPAQFPGFRFAAASPRFAGAADLRSTAAAQDQSAEADAMTVLLMGVDAREAEAIDVGVRADAIVVLHVDATAGTCRLLSIPRDARVEVPGTGLTKINHALAVGGVPLQTEVVSTLLGVPIDRYALVDFAAFATLIDALGGVTVDVADPFTFDDQVFAVGPQVLDGESALAYIRYRGDAAGDFGRIGRQQQVVRAVADRLNPLVVTRLASLLPALASHVRTDLSLPELTTLALHYLDTCRPDQLAVGTLSGPTEAAWDPLLQQNLDYVILDPADVEAKVATLLGGE